MSKSKKNGVIGGSVFDEKSFDEIIAEIDREVGRSRTVIPFLNIGSFPDLGSFSEEVGKSKDLFIRFYLGDILLAIPLQSATEIGQKPMITPLPNLPDWVLGISNIRGEIVSLVNLKGFFGLSPADIKRSCRYIVVRNQDMKVGLVVDRILGLFSPSRNDADIQASPYEEGELSTFISGVIATEKHLLNILDIDKLLTSPRMNAFRSG